ncbi:sugar transporter [Trichophyton mentagrophytes]|uniref:Major facilitator superfamily (MFS) profile domain-containing protein n=1 Tax=Trichophyton interdigitale (strain MR816) TaxID=1215338 RepID=A0A059J581_TRIIM|nr:hypothetical protein H101_06703 [Trichophyton interdigitale H6]KAG5207303.1 putative Hexose carrier protein [Trichophyton interdigitale]KDB22949.1 hypothetical protein H109_05139 [Trichophyton interdigitale MR816]GBF65556.1 sugar transporter [Trichophyton mentagrophytes]KAG5217874.1 putative Hexose carrier protein [Trichophyton interdigitale]
MAETPTYGGMSGKTLSRSVSTIATCGFLLFGYDQGVMAGIISAMPFNTVFPETKDNPTNQGFVTAIYEIGCLLGAISIIWGGDMLGRRKSIITGAIIMAIGAIIQVTSFAGHQPYAQFIIGRIITGVGNGINTSTIPTYQAECSHTSNRGLLICIEGATIAFGTLIAYWIDYGASYGADSFSWRFPIAFQIAFSIVMVTGMIWLPESPRWLCMRDRSDEGERVIAALHGVPITDPLVQAEKNAVMESIRASGEVGKPTPLSVVFTGGKTQHRRRMFLGVFGQFAQQLSGCNAIIYFFPVLFEKSIGVDHNMATLLGGVNMIVYSIFATTSWFLIERAGRRKLFLYGAAGQAISMTITFACLIPNTPSTAKGAAVGLFTYIASFGATWLPLPWLYAAEISPIKTRAKANALSTCSNWLFNFFIVMITPVMLAGIGWGTYLFFAIINVCFLPIIYFFYPETAKRSLEEIDIIFAKGYCENKSYVQAARELPYLTEEEISRMDAEYGHGKPSQTASPVNEKESDSEQ